MRKAFRGPLWTTEADGILLITKSIKKIHTIQASRHMGDQMYQMALDFTHIFAAADYLIEKKKKIKEKNV